MCGIFASIGLASDPARIDLVSHRGPDGRGWDVYESAAGPVALGHRRLAIIDLSEAGHQPSADFSGRYRLTFNGEIYNYLELREELRAMGQTFSTETDSEVLLSAFIVWGEGCLPRLSGMFAFVIWDQQTQTLFAARDRFGIKPLYVVEADRSVALASEIKQLAGLPGATGRANIPRVHDFLASGMSDHTEETMFSGIWQLRGGECLKVATSDGRPQLLRKRWSDRSVARLELSEEEASARFSTLLRDSVRLHLRSDVPVGSCLSGGLDSSSIVGIMAGLIPDGVDVHTVSACYAEKSVDEKPFMDDVILHTGARPHFVYPRAEDVFDHASDITWHQDEPFGSTSILAQWNVFAEARKSGIKVMLDGQGADEQLAGYHFAFPYHLASGLRSGRVLQTFQTILQRQSVHGASVVSQLARLASAMVPSGAAQELRRLRQKNVQNGWLETAVLREHGNSAGALATAARGIGMDIPRDVGGLCDLMTYASNLPMLLHWEDRSSMAHSIEARVPFLHGPLVDFSLALGNTHKIVGAETKRVLRRAMADVLPESVRTRQDKLGFATPESVWFKGPLRTLMHEGVENTLQFFPDLLNATGVRRLRDDMLSGRKPMDASLWRIVNLGIWGRRFNIGL